MANGNTFNQKFTNRVLETRDPRQLIVITKTWMKNNGEKSELVEQFYDERAERPLDKTFYEQVKATGYVHTPLFITDVEGVGEIVVAGRQRLNAALALGLPEVPVISHDPGQDLSIELELSENLARSESSVLENAKAFKKALQKGISKEKLALIAGLTETMIYNTILIGELPKFVLDMINKGELTQTAALQLTKTYGDKAPKGSGLTKVYSEESQSKMKEALANMSLEAKLQGGGKRISVRQARSTSAKGVDELSHKNWDALIESEDTPDDYKALIKVFRNKVSWKQARGEYPEHLFWLSKLDPKPKEKKEAKPKKEKADKPKKQKEVEEGFDPAELFR